MCSSGDPLVITVAAHDVVVLKMQGRYAAYCARCDGFFSFSLVSVCYVRFAHSHTVYVLSISQKYLMSGACPYNDRCKLFTANGLAHVISSLISKNTGGIWR